MVLKMLGVVFLVVLVSPLMLAPLLVLSAAAWALVRTYLAATSALQRLEADRRAPIFSQVLPSLLLFLLLSQHPPPPPKKKRSPKLGQERKDPCAHAQVSATMQGLVTIRALNKEAMLVDMFDRQQVSSKRPPKTTCSSHLLQSYPTNTRRVVRHHMLHIAHIARVFFYIIYNLPLNVATLTTRDRTSTPPATTCCSPAWAGWACGWTSPSPPSTWSCWAGSPPAPAPETGSPGAAAPSAPSSPGSRSSPSWSSGWSSRPETSASSWAAWRGGSWGWWMEGGTIGRVASQFLKSKKKA